jgi:hypothetical protein
MNDFLFIDGMKKSSLVPVIAVVGEDSYLVLCKMSNHLSSFGGRWGALQSLQPVHRL